jgi:hypothetical protein
VFLLAQTVYVKVIRALTPREEDMGEVPCMDIACSGAALNRTRDGTSKVVESVGVVGVDVVGVDALSGRASRERLENGLEGATRHKPQQVAELVVNRQRDGVLDGHTWQGLVWRDRVKSQLQRKDRLESTFVHRSTMIV